MVWETLKDYFNYNPTVLFLLDDAAFYMDLLAMFSGFNSVQDILILDKKISSTDSLVWQCVQTLLVIIYGSGGPLRLTAEHMIPYFGCSVEFLSIPQFIHVNHFGWLLHVFSVATDGEGSDKREIRVSAKLDCVRQCNNHNGVHNAVTISNAERINWVPNGLVRILDTCSTDEKYAIGGAISEHFVERGREDLLLFRRQLLLLLILGGANCCKQ